MASRKTMYLFTDVEETISRYGDSFLAPSTKPGKIRGKLSLAGVIRAMVVNFGRIMDATDHGLTAEEVEFVYKVHAPIKEDGDFPVNPLLWAMVFAYRGEKQENINPKNLSKKLRSLTPAQESALAMDFVRIYSGLDLNELLTSERAARLERQKADAETE